VDDQRDARDLVVDRHRVLHPVLVLAQHRAVVGGQHDDGVAPEIERVHLVPELAEPVVGHRQQRRVALADVLDRLGAVFAFPVVGPVVERAVPGVAVELEVLRDDVERLVRVEELELEEPVVAAAVVGQPADGVLDAARAGELLLLPLSQPVKRVPLVVAHRQTAEARRQRGQVDAADPAVVLLAALELPGVEAVVVPLAAEVEVVVVVGDQVGEDRPGRHPAQLLGQHVVEGLQRAPAALQEVVAAGHELAPRRHAGQGADPVVVEDDRALGQPGDVGRVDPVVAVGLEVVLAQRVEDDEQGLHRAPSPPPGVSSVSIPPASAIPATAPVRYHA
jgi:hypothetical protein